MEEISDKALDEAAGALMGADDGVPEEEESTTVETKEEEAKPEEKKDIDFEDLLQKGLHEVKSDWGRKHAASEKQITELQGMVQSLVSVMEAGQQKEDRGEEYIPQTKEELDAYLDRRDQARMHTQQQYDKAYEDGYVQTLASLTSGYNANVAGVLDKTVRDEFNVRYSDDPAADAERNFLKAKIKIMEQAVERKKNPLQGNAPTGPLGGATGSENDMRGNVPIQLDDYAADFAKSQGMEDDDVQKALSGPVPTYIGGIT